MDQNKTLRSYNTGEGSFNHPFMQKRFEHLLCVKHCSRCWDTATQTEKVTLPPRVLRSTGEADNYCEENE